MAKFCIKHKVTTLLAVIMISIFGVAFTTQLQMSLLPNMEAPMAMVMCYYNGATPEDIEELVTRPLESAIMSVSGVDSVQSSSSDGVSQVQITYVDGTDLDIAATKLREKFDMLSLPDGATDPVIVNINISECKNYSSCKWKCKYKCKSNILCIIYIYNNSNILLL